MQKKTQKSLFKYFMKTMGKSFELLRRNFGTLSANIALLYNFSEISRRKIFILFDFYI